MLSERFPAAADGFGQLEVVFIASVLLSLVTYLVGAIDDSLADPDTVAVSGTNAIYRGAFIFAALITGVAFGIQLVNPPFPTFLEDWSDHSLLECRASPAASSMPCSRPPASSLTRFVDS